MITSHAPDRSAQGKPFNQESAPPRAWARAPRMKKLDRFEIRRILGQGSQGQVYLCRDPKLERLVAIKLLNRSLAGNMESETDLLHEARTMSRVHHPNIVSVFDMGQHGKQPFLVFEYVDGHTLKDRVRKGPLSTADALNIIEGMLAGMARAHEQGIVHRDLKPANIMLDSQGVPKITDFGIARMLSGQGEVDSELVGTPRYMAPEYIRSGKVLMQSDVFSIGLVAYELLTGQVAYDGRNAMDLLRRISEDPVVPPSKVNKEVDDKLEKLLLKSLEKDPYARFDDAAAMLSAWREYRQQTETVATAQSGSSGNSTVDFLLRRIQHKSDFPALSRTVSTLNQLSRSDDKDIAELTNLIVKDYGLTSKILKVVNSAYYGHFSGTIGTVSRAIVVIGTKGIRSIAASLALLDHFGNRKDMEGIREQLAESLFSAVMARELMSEIDKESIEEAFLGALLHNLGHILVSFYLPEEEAEIRRLVDNEGFNELRAQMKVLSTTYDRVGQAVAEQWNFPGNIRDCLESSAELQDKPARSKSHKLRLVTSLSNELTRELRNAPPEERTNRIQQTTKRYQKALSVGRKQLGSALKISNREFMDFQTDFASTRDKEKFLRQVNPASTSEPEAADNTAGGEDKPVDKARGNDAEITVVVEEDGRISRHVGGGNVDREQMLSEGMQEITQLLVSRVNTGQLVNLVLETLYRSMRFNRIIACLFDPRQKKITGRTGIGDEVQRLIDGFHFRYDRHGDVFNLALQKGADIYIKDATQKSFQERLPKWFTEVSRPGSFFILPLLANGKLLGMIYAEYDRVDGFDEDPKVLGLVKSVRSQLVLGIMTR